LQIPSFSKRDRGVAKEKAEEAEKASRSKKRSKVKHTALGQEVRRAVFMLPAKK
jgi:hypothetical protein